MLQRARGLSARALEAVADLERRVVAADGGRLKLDWGTLRSRSGDRVEDLLWWEGDRLVGFLGLYAFGSSVELSGMVAPAARRRGVATRLLDAALPLCRERAYRQVLLVVPRPSSAGHALAGRLGGVIDHSEHALVLRGRLASPATGLPLTLRAATRDDVATVVGLLRAGFGRDTVPEDLSGADLARSLLVELDGVPVGALRVEPQEEDAAVYGFVVHPDHQGRGIGREVLRRVCQEQLARGARHVLLEVAVDNDRALGLYTSLGFARTTTEDYYALPPGR